jgi:hypothetical protein
MQWRRFVMYFFSTSSNNQAKCKGTVETDKIDSKGLKNGIDATNIRKWYRKIFHKDGRSKKRVLVLV